MMYKPETIVNYVKKAREALKRAKSKRVLKSMHFRMAYGNKKVGKSLNINTLAVLTCGGMCRKCGCCRFCYAIKDALRFINVFNARLINTALALYDRDRFFLEIFENIRKHPSFDFIRWHVSGEIIDYDYFSRMVALARLFPDRRFWTYTKQYGIINAYVAVHGGSIASALPDNFVVMFSDWDGFPMDNKYGFPLFKFYPSEKKIPSGEFICPANCDICKAKKTGCIYGQSASVMEH